MRKLLLGALCCAFLGCPENPPTEPTPTPQITPTATAASTTTPTNPVCSGLLKFRQGTLWKPVSESDGKCVFLIRPEFQRPMKCFVETKDWGADAMRFTSIGNGNRQHHRCNKKATRIKDKAIITCEDAGQVCQWQLPGEATKRWE